MKTPLAWISLYTPLDTLIASHEAKSLAHTYSTHTAEIDGIEKHTIPKVVVGKVLSVEKHPESKKLSIVRVHLGEHGEETILTGAPNIAEATYVPVAIVGAVLGGDFVIGERMMAGMMSRGMICGADEIGMSTEESTGIMILEEIWDADFLETMIGKSFFSLTLPFPGREGKPYQYTIGDTVFEIDNKFITNRPDLFSVLGNAREWGAVFGLKFEDYVPTLDTISPNSQSSNTGFLHSQEGREPLKLSNSQTLKLSIKTDKCLAYNAIKMENITVEKSPLGIALMMERAGLSPKMDLVDITNCISVDFGQPMHVFDADKVQGGITVRLAKDGEKLLALNDIEYTLTKDDMVIADDMGPIALAGIIGGKESAVSETTKNIIWESATFDATSVRLSAQRHAVRTDASTRYEKSLDPLLAKKSLGRIMDYLRFLGKNIDITGYAEYLDKKRVNTITLDVSYDFINMKAGIAIPEEKVKEILENLGFMVSVISSGSNSGSREISTLNSEFLNITVPSWRASKDISIKEDIAEEVSRIYGYDNTPLTPLTANFSISQKNTVKSERDAILRILSGKGWNEVYNYSFTNTLLDEKIGYSDMSDAVMIQNAFNEEYTHMRRSLAPRLFTNIHENLKHTSALKFFEIGKCYFRSGKRDADTDTLLSKIEKKPFSEKRMIAGVQVGGNLESLRKDMELLLSELCGHIPELSSHTGSGEVFLHPGISGIYHDGDTRLLTFGKIHPETAINFSIPKDTLYFEIDFDTILSETREKEMSFQPISKFQSIDRELGFVMDENESTGNLASMIDAHHPWIHNVVVDSIYRDTQKLGAGKKSVNFSFVLQSHESTISDTDALGVQNSVIELAKEHGYSIRG